MKPGFLRHVLPALLCAAAVLCVVFYFAHETETPVVALPSPPGSGDSLLSTDVLGQGQYLTAAVTPETVQAVVSTLERTGSYSRSVTVERFWDGGSHSESIDCHMRDGSAHLVVTGSGDEKHILLADGQLYIWYGSGAHSYSGELSPVSESSSLPDELTGILTYEELLSLDTEQITDAGYTLYNGESCISADYRYGVLGYSSRVYISIATGLLMGAERYDGDTLIYRMSSDTPVIETPEDSWFELPS
ncbi:MAG: hypothetical protein ACOX81_06090 [Candidatus Heteroscillospira sp.]|jgi:hypothetical protein